MNKEESLSNDAAVEIASEESEHVEIAKAETKGVRLLRFVVVGVLLTTATCVSLGVYLFSADKEKDEFRAAFDSHATKVINSLKVGAENQLKAMHSLATFSSTISRDVNGTSLWPFVTIPDWSVVARDTMAQVQSFTLALYHFVSQEQREEWNQYVAGHYSWKALDFQRQAEGWYSKKLNPIYNDGPTGRVLQDANKTTPVEEEKVDLSMGYGLDIHDTVTGLASSPDLQVFAPMWQTAPTLPAFIENHDGISFPGNREAFEACRDEHAAVTGPSFNTEGGLGNQTLVDFLLFMWGREDEAIGSDPLGYLFYPIHAQDDFTSEVVGIVMMFTHWRQLFVDILPPDATGITVVFENSCGQSLTYVINGKDVSYLDEYDLHDPTYDSYRHSIDLTEDFNANLSPLYYGVPISKTAGCLYTLHVYPSKQLEELFITKSPLIYTICVLSIFLFAILVFVTYDCLVERRQRLVLENALASGAIVSSMFPKEIKERMMKEQETNARKKQSYASSGQRLKSLLDRENDDDDDDDAVIDTAPLAEFFPEATVMFADIEVSSAKFHTSLLLTLDSLLSCGKSASHPGQVNEIPPRFSHCSSQFIRRLTGLQRIIRCSKSRRWETAVSILFTVLPSTNACMIRRPVEDVAVAGLPSRQSDHATRMVRFAHSCLIKFSAITKKLEVVLGPDTGDLKMRFGLHTGPCTGGVLRGDKTRFQLFGDTVNMASRMESSGIPNRIHTSNATAESLREAGKEGWFEQRAGEVHLKGKGLVTTYFIAKFTEANSIASHDVSTTGSYATQQSKKTARLVAWCVETLASRLREVVARRYVVKGEKFVPIEEQPILTSEDRGGRTCLDEIEEVISMPRFNAKVHSKEVNPPTVDLGLDVMNQLRAYVLEIAGMYNTNPFHNFEHASHVTMSCDKLLKRIVAPDIQLVDDIDNSGIMMGLHDYTYGITSDPITQFGIILSALIHDVDHVGASNAQLAKENPELDRFYKGKSIAEQNSIDLAWDALMKPEYRQLRNCIYTDKKELHRFQQTVLSVVLATDIFDKELNDLRKRRWARAFAKKETFDLSNQDDMNVKATIVIEHLIQASDVSHTMQHWNVYRKWNERLFREMTKAYQAGRMAADPADFWYKGEIGFFDNYIIPLARKLKECNVFGVSSDEFLNYAKANRDEWVQKGQEIVAELVERMKNEVLEDKEEGDLDEESLALEGNSFFAI